MWITCGLLLCFYQLSLMASIHYRGSTSEQVIRLHFSEFVLIKKQNHLHLGWPKGFSANFFFFFFLAIILNLEQNLPPTEKY